MPIDSDVLRRARKGNITAAIEVMSDCYPQVYRLAYGLTGRDDVGRGLVQYVMKHGLRQLPTWRDDDEPMRWCRHHTLLTTRRAAKYQPNVTNDTLVRHAQTENAYYAGFVRAVRALPIQQKEAFILAHGEPWDTRAIAVAMDCSQDAAAVHLREATRVLTSLGGNQFATFTAQLSQTYKSLTPSEELVLTNVQWNTRRYLWPRKVWKWIKLLITLALLAAIVLFVWKIYPKLVY